ncbi:MAG: hypothetical protein CMF58_02030 [Lentimicrobiaceae bacterium]|jgi:F0F1-type ATP synthase assembly protein I|nr:hypothetical protein [Lentimicrobiaceae bacterium]MDG2081812.1 AtpZ/AtpI family protein [Bacteroidales bacterium]|tara:strand:+ start:76 stop:294 length:219 start_codon:yes stop_codon:yes gene_type:complete
MKEDKNESPLKFYAKYSTLALQMIVIILIGAFGGKALDGYLEWDFPVFTLAFTLLCVAGSIFYGMRELFRSK